MIFVAAILLFANEREIALGRSINAELRERTPAIEDAQINAYVARIADRFREQSPVPLQVEVTTSTDKRQAASLPGGFLRIPLGAILQAETEVDLAITVAHAVAHLAQRHHFLRQPEHARNPLIGWSFHYGDDALIPRAAIGHVRQAEAEAEALAAEWTRNYKVTGEFETIRNRARGMVPVRKKPTLRKALRRPPEPGAAPEIDPGQRPG